MILENTQVQLANGSDQNNGKPIVFTIEAGQTDSNIQDYIGSTLLALAFPTGTDAATFTLMVSIDGDNFYRLTDGYNGNPISVAAVAGDFARVLPQDMAGVKFMKLVSSVTQNSTIEIQIISGQVL